MLFGVALGGLAAFLLLMVTRSGRWSWLILNNEPSRDADPSEGAEEKPVISPEVESETAESDNDEAVETLELDWLEAHATTHVGLVREENQDRFVLERFEGDKAVLALVADGMGGHSGGSVASEVASKAIKSLVLKSEELGEKALHNALHDSFARADEAIRHRASKELKLQGMGTTAVAAVVTSDFFVHAYTGDSRLYHFRDSELIYRTQDHSVVRYLQEEGLVTEEEARHHPMRSRLTSSLGGSPPERKILVEPAWKKRAKKQPSVIDFRSGDLVVICSDGLNGEIEPTQLEQVVKEHGQVPKQCVQHLLNAALESGARDNVTIICLRHK